MNTKICKICNVEKSFTSFKPFNRTDGSIGYLSVCGSCRFTAYKERKAANVSLHNPPYFDESKNEYLRVCSKCHTAKSLGNFHKNKSFKCGFDSLCKVCKKKKDADKYNRQTTTQKEAIIEKRKTSNFREVQKLWLKANKEKRKIYLKEYRKKPERLAYARRLWTDKTPEEKQAYYDANRERLRNGSMRRRARGRNCGFIFPFTKADIIKRDGFNCYLCGKLTTEKESHIEHVLPLSRGGHHKPENVKISCPFCNQSKGNKTLTEYKKRRGDYDGFKI